MVTVSLGARTAGRGTSSGTVRRTGGSSAALVLAITALVTAPATARPTLPTEAGPVCAATAESQEAAAAIAARCGHAVEAVSGRTEWETHFALPDGTARLDVSMAAVRTRDGSGGWKAIDTSVVTSVEGLAVASPVTPMTFSDGQPGQPLARIVRDGHELTFDVPFTLPKPTVSGPQLTYTDVLPDVDLIVTVNDDATGFTEVLRVKSPLAAADPRLDDLRFPVGVTDGLEVVASRGGFVAQTPSGETIFTSPTPAMWDSAGPGLAELPAYGTADVVRPGSPRGSEDAGTQGAARRNDRAVAPLGGESIAWMPARVERGEVVITPDAGMLEDPGTVWPVYIDPSVSASAYQWTAVRDAYGPHYGFSPDQGVGLCNRASSTTCPTTFRSRLLWQFAGLAEIGALEPSQVISAHFSVVGTHSWDCTPRPVTLYRVAGFNASTSWPGGGLWDPLSTNVVAHKSTCAAHPVRWIEFSATSAAQAVAAANTSELALGMYADESSMAYWKRYRYDAAISITYNRPPSAPTGLKTSTPSTTCGGRPMMNSTTPTLRAVLADPDGGNVHGHFDLFNAATGAHVWNPPLTTAKASGSEHTITVPSGFLAHGGIYQWRANGRDPYGVNGHYLHCEFVVDLVAPTTPGITPVSGQPGVYTENGWAGGVGKTGKFTFTNAATDVTTYRYSFDNTALTSSVAATAPTVAYTPTTVGPHTLRVQAVDAAGWTSPVRTYTFNVTFPSVAGLWLLDEGAGSTAADSKGTGTLLPLTLSSSTTWSDGVLAEFGEDASDDALLFDSSADVASTSGPVVATRDSFTVMATVKTSTSTGSATAVSQDGVSASGFELGYRADGSCPGGLARCWVFTMRPSDGTSTPVKALSAQAVQPGSWVHLAGVHDAATDSISLYVCQIGNPDDPGDLTPRSTGSVGFVSSWNATRGLQVGRAKEGGVATRGWTGEVSDVQVLTGVADMAKVTRSCNRALDMTP